MTRFSSSATSSLAAAKRHARRRVRQRGAVAFIVSMTIAVLASLGIFAIISATTEVKSAGYERQALQTHYLAEFAMIAAAQKVGPDYAQAIEAQMRTATDYNSSYVRNHCISLEAVPPATAAVNKTDAASRECKILQMQDLTQGWSLDAPNGLRAPTTTVPGSLGAINTNLTGYYMVEVTDPIFGSPVAGMANVGQQLTTVCPITFTVTTFGALRPNDATSNAAHTYGSESVEEGRARLTGGPIPCPQ